MKLYFVRHGESEANILMEFSNSGIKHPLTESGLEQAQAVAQSLYGSTLPHESTLSPDQAVRNDSSARLVYSSPVLRARQTAQIIADSLQAPLEFSEALREWSVGVYEGTRDPSGWALHRQVQEDWFWQGKLESKMPGGESFLEIKARFVPFIQRLLDNGKPDRQIVLVAHGGLYLAMLPVILQNIDQDFALEHLFPYTGVVEAETRDIGLYCLSWCGIGINE